VTANPLAPDWLRQPGVAGEPDANALAATVWPRNAVRAASGEITLAGATATALAAEFGTPLYVVDEGDVKSRAAEVLAAFTSAFGAVGSTAHVYYAGKAFLSTEIARWVTAAGLNIDVCSGGELAVALAAGVDPARLGFHGNNKSLAEIDRGVEVGVGAIVLDSVVEVERVAAAAEKHGRVQAVRLRINSGVHASTHEFLATAHEDQKFGVPLADAPDVVAAIRSHASLRFLGLHSHIGSQIFESDGFAEAAGRLLMVHAGLLEGGEVPELNLGGGFGIAYTSADEVTPIATIAQELARVVAAECAALGIPVPAIAVEPGRAIIGPSTVTLYEVGTIKDVTVSVGDSGETAVRKYVSVDGGMSDNIRTALYDADYCCTLASRDSDAMPVLTRVVGKHCEAGDVVVKDEFLPSDLTPGDLLAVPGTGAYCRSMASQYNHVPRPPVIAVRDGVAKVLLRRETEDDILALDVS